MNCMIIDGDKDSRILISLLIRQNNLGNVVSRTEKMENAIEDILFYHPDLLLIDQMLPDQKGLEIINGVINRGYKGKIIVISEQKDPDVIAQAYESGILFFLHKPVNQAELISIFKHVKRMCELEHSIFQINQVLLRMHESFEPVKTLHQDIGSRLDEIFTELGIVGFSGTEEIREVLEHIYHIQKQDEHKMYHLKDVYREVCIKLHGSENELIAQKNMEQRIRRTIQKALGNLAELGCEDYYDPVFTKYANVLFDFKQVRQEMQHIKDPQAYAGKINTKKFMEGILSRVD